MPYRRLPNTDLARIRALRAAVVQGSLSGLYTLPLSLHTLSEARTYLQKFEVVQKYYIKCLDGQAQAARKYQQYLKTARLYLSHFIQVLNMAVIRGEIKEADKRLYGLSATEHHLPDLANELAVIEWGRKVIEGERHRTAQGGAPIYNPAIAKVKVHYELFLDSFERQRGLQTLTARSLEELAAMRGRADELIRDIWNQVESAYQDVSPLEVRLNFCREYGLIYYYRAGEQPAE